MSTPERVTFVTGGDKRYFPMILELIHSIRRFPQSAGIDICVIDAGLTPEQVRHLEDGLVQKVVSPDWPGPLAARQGKLKGQDHLKACVARPFIPQHFPGYDIYIWLDGDVWVQDWSAVEVLITGARLDAITICPEVDRAYGKVTKISWIGPMPWRPRSFLYSNGKKAFSGKVARSLYPWPGVNAGVFSMRATVPYWARWQELIVKALRKGKIFTAEQLTLGMMIYLEGAKVEFLPSVYNWICAFNPMWDEKTQSFVEPYLPHNTIGIVHLCAMDDMRRDRSATVDTKTTDGRIVPMSYRYPFFDGIAESTDVARAA